MSVVDRSLLHRHDLIKRWSCSKKAIEKSEYLSIYIYKNKNKKEWNGNVEAIKKIKSEKERERVVISQPRRLYRGEERPITFKPRLCDTTCLVTNWMDVYICLEAMLFISL